MSAPCRLVRKHLDAFVDGELDTSMQVEFEGHLAECAVCREHAAFSRSIKRAVGAELGAVRAPERLRLRLVTAMQSAPPPGPVRIPGAPPPGPVRTTDRAQPLFPSTPPEERFGSGEAANNGHAPVRFFLMPARYAVPAAAAAVFMIAFATTSDDGDAEEAAAASTAPLFEDVVRRHSREHPTEVAGPPQQVVGWFRGKLEFPVRPVEFGEADAHFIGARLSNVRDREAAAFYYDVHGRRVTVLVFEPPQRPLRGVQRVSVHGRDLYYRQVGGYTVPVVEHEGITYAFTGDLDSRSMIQLAASARVH